MTHFKKQMEIIFIRHGESTGNNENRIQTLNETLTEKGLHQVYSLKKRIDEETFDVVFSSSMKRCQETTEILFENRKIPVFFTDLLHEKRNGDYEGKKISEIDWTEMNKQPFEQRKAPNGESLLEVRVRAKRFLDFLRTGKWSRVAVVSHGTFIRLVLSSVQEKPIEEIITNLQIGNCTITKLEFSNNTFKVMND